MSLQLKRGFLKTGPKEKAHEDMGSLHCFSPHCSLYSRVPRIVNTDCRVASPGSSHFLFLPPDDSQLVFIDTLDNLKTIAKWKLWQNAGPRTSTQGFAIRTSGDKGLGIFATQPITRGTVICQERPRLVTHPAVLVSSDQARAFYRSALAGLCSTAQNEIATLRNAHPELEHIRGIVCTNALAAKVPYAEVRYPALYPRLCRANHDCTPNAHYFFCSETFTGRFVALRTISAGEEITIGYTELAASRKERQARLLEKYRFQCTCATCSAASAHSDDKRSAIAQYFGEMRGRSKPEEMARLKELIQWAEDEGLDEAASVLMVSSLKLIRRNHDPVEKAKIMVKAMDYIRVLEGNDSAGFKVFASRMEITTQELSAMLDRGLDNFDYTLFPAIATMG